MKFDSKTIETISVSELKKSLASTGFLEPNINENDREMSWDGYVSVYKSSNHSKETLIGKVPVQVKGHICSDLSKEAISYSANVDDLKNYLYDGGVVYLVIHINDDASQAKIYYIELPPIKLRLLINEAGQQKTKTIHLKPLPEERNEKSTIFYNCLQNCKKQTSFSVINLKTIEELEREGILESIVIPVSSFGNNMELINNDVYLYARIKGTDILQPIELIPTKKSTHERKDSIVSINERVYYNEIEIIKNIDSVRICIGNSFSIEVFLDNSPSRVDYKNSDYLREYIVDVDFMIQYIENKYFLLDGVKIPLVFDDTDLSNFDISIQKERLAFLSDFVKVLDLLNCPKDLQLSSLSENDWRNMKILKSAFIKKEAVYLKEGLPPIIKFSVGALSFVLCLHLCEGETKKYHIYDFFKTEVALSYENDNGEKNPTSQYAILQADDFLTIDNIRYDLLLPSFQRIKYHNELISRANWFLLDILNAYDKSNNDQLLSVAHDFINWIISKKPDVPEYKVNYMQILKRERELNIIEITELYNMINEYNNNAFLLTAIHILLGQEPLARIQYSRLSQEQKDAIKSYPIFHFCSNKDRWK